MQSSVHCMMEVDEAADAFNMTNDSGSTRRLPAENHNTSFATR